MFKLSGSIAIGSLNVGIENSLEVVNVRAISGSRVIAC